MCYGHLCLWNKQCTKLCFLNQWEWLVWSSFSSSHYSVTLLVLIHDWMYSIYMYVLLLVVFCYMCRNVFCELSQFCNCFVSIIHARSVKWTVFWSMCSWSHSLLNWFLACVKEETCLHSIQKGRTDIWQFLTVWLKINHSFFRAEKPNVCVKWLLNNLMVYGRPIQLSAHGPVPACQSTSSKVPQFYNMHNFS